MIQKHPKKIKTKPLVIRNPSSSSIQIPRHPPPPLSDKEHSKPLTAGSFATLLPWGQVVISSTGKSDA